MNKYSWTRLDNLKEGNYRGRKTRQKRILAKFPRPPFWSRSWIDIYRVGLSRDWYKPKSAVKKRNDKRRPTKPR